jgi:hypothetical protein
MDADMILNHGMDRIFAKNALEITSDAPMPIMPVHWMAKSCPANDGYCVYGRAWGVYLEVWFWCLGANLADLQLSAHLVSAPKAVSMREAKRSNSLSGTPLYQGTRLAMPVYCKLSF